MGIWLQYTAVAIFWKVLSRIRPDYANGHYRLGNALYKLGKRAEAISSYSKALQIKPDYAEAHNNLGNALNDLGNYKEALVHYIKAFGLAPDRVVSWHNISRVLRMISFERYSWRFENLFFGLLGQETVVRPSQYVMPILSLLKLHPLVKEALQISAAGRIPESASDICAKLSTIPLFLRIIELCPIPDFEVESLLTELRREILLRGNEIIDKSSAIGFQVSLALHCFTNEFVFYEHEDETTAVEALETNIRNVLAGGGEPDPFAIARIASYRPLYRYAWSHDLMGPESLKELYKRQVKDVLEEASLRPDIPRLKKIEDQVSRAVREQYEENPYPRWVNTRLLAEPLTISALGKALELKTIAGFQGFSNRPEVLIAGCGTGQHPLGTASKFLNSRVLAVDLSLSSLGHAIRKTRELGVTNIKYMQADILDLGSLQRKFDVIESVGVLHHMGNPIAGWKVLVDCLKPGGLMKIGLYSELASRSVIEARRMVAATGLGSNIQDIRKFRRLAFEQNGENGLRELVARWPDFYSASDCRDLFFHVQAHRFTLRQIEKALDALGLTFIGFEFPREGIKNQFRRDYPDPQAAYSLDAWHDFEIANPATFVGMYQFWVQSDPERRTEKSTPALAAVAAEMATP